MRIQADSNNNVASSAVMSKKALDVLFEQLVGFRNTILFALLGVAGQSSASDVRSKDDLANRTAYLHLIYGALGNVIFLISFIWNVSGECSTSNVKKTLEKQLAGKNLYFFFSFWFSLFGGSMVQYMLSHEDARGNNNLFVAVQFILGLSVYFTGFDVHRHHKNFEIERKKVIERIKTMRHISFRGNLHDAHTMDTPLENCSFARALNPSKLSGILVTRAFFEKLVAFRKSFFVSGTSSVIQPANRDLTTQKELVENNATTDLLFGSIGIALAILAVFYISFSQLSKDIGKKKTLKLLFHGRPLQLLLCFAVSICSGIAFYIGWDVMSLIASALSGYLMGAQADKLPAKVGKWFSNPTELEDPLHALNEMLGSIIPGSENSSEIPVIVADSLRPYPGPGFLPSASGRGLVHDLLPGIDVTHAHSEEFEEESPVNTRNETAYPSVSPAEPIAQLDPTLFSARLSNGVSLRPNESLHRPQSFA